MILGDLQGIRDYVYEHAARPAPPAWRFRDDRQHWIYHHATDTGWPIRDELVIEPGEQDPQLLSPWGIWAADAAPVLYVEGSWQTADTTATVFWSTTDQPGFAAERAIMFTVIPDGQRRVYEVKLADSAGYRGRITGLRLDPVGAGHAGETIRLRSIGFQRPAD